MKPEQDSEKLRKALSYLNSSGMDREQLRDLHHSPDRTETFARAISYRDPGPAKYDEVNLAYHRRLLFVAAEHWRTGASIAGLVERALEVFPQES